MSSWTRDTDYKPDQMPRPMTPSEIIEALGNGNREVPHVEVRPGFYAIWVADDQVLATVIVSNGEEDASRDHKHSIAHAIANAGPTIDRLCLEIGRMRAALSREALEAVLDKTAWADAILAHLGVEA